MICRIGNRKALFCLREEEDDAFLDSAAAVAASISFSVNSSRLMNGNVRVSTILPSSSCAR